MHITELNHDDADARRAVVRAWAGEIAVAERDLTAGGVTAGTSFRSDSDTGVAAGAVASSVSVAAAWHHADATLRDLWPALVAALGGRETRALLLQELSDLAEQAAGLLLAAVRVAAAVAPGTASTAAGVSISGGLQHGYGSDGAAVMGSEGLQMPAGPPVLPSRTQASTAAAWAAGHALGTAGAACCHQLSEEPAAGLAWLRAQGRVVQAVRLADEGRGDGPAPAPPPLLPLWSCLKGVPGLRSRSPQVRAAALQLLVDTVLLQQQREPRAQSAGSDEHTKQPGGGVSGGTGGGSAGGGHSAAAADVSAWVVCQELACRVAPRDSDPGVRAAALRGATALLEVAKGGAVADPREWRRLAEGVLQSAASAAPAATGQAGTSPVVNEVWEAALAFARQHGNAPGWRAAVGALQSQLLRATAAEEEEGPLATYGIAAVCRAVAGAVALEAALRLPMGLLQLGAGQVEAEAQSVPDEAAAATATGDAVELLVAAATCVSDAVRRHGPGSDDAAAGMDTGPEQAWDGGCGGGGGSGGEAEWQRVLLLGAAPGAVSASGTAGSGAGDQGQRTQQEQEGGAEEGAQAEALAVAASARATCCNVGLLLGAAGAMSAVEALIGRAESAPLAPKPPGASPSPSCTSSSATAGATASRAALLIAAAAVVAGAADSLRSASGAMPTTRKPSQQQQLLIQQQLAGVEHLAAAVRVARLMRRIAALLQDPDNLLFAEAGGAPATPAGPAAAAARQHHLMVAAGLAALTALLAALPAPLLFPAEGQQAGRDGEGSEATGAAAGKAAPKEQEWTRRLEDEQGGGVMPGFGGHSRRPQVVIEELSSPTAVGPAPAPLPEQQTASEWRQQQQPLVASLVLLCSTYAPCTTNNSNNNNGGTATPSSTDPGLPPPPAHVFTPWASSSASAGAEALFEALAARTHVTPSPSRALRSPSAAAAAAAGSLSSPSAGGSLALLAAEEVAAQELLAGCLGGLLREHIRPVVVQKHVQDLEDGPIQPYNGPDTFTRAVAARRLAWLLMRSRHPFSSEALRLGLPPLLAACDDPAPGVAAYGIAALHAAAVECLAADLQWQRDLLLEQARRLVVGCSEQLWSLACPAAVALVRRIEGKDPRAPGYHRLASELLGEMERQAHVAARRLPFLPAASRLVACLGLTTARYLSRLMPLLLEWLHATDRDSRLGALALLAAVVRATWPRMPAHAAALWRHMLLVLLRAEGGKGEGQEVGAGEGRVGGAQDEVVAAQEVCTLLLAAAREQVASFQPVAAGLPAGAECIHLRLLTGGCGAVGAGA